jgi:subtilase family serine protease
MMMVLQPSSDQEHALRTLLDQQQDKNTGSFHQWMTPNSFEASYGVAKADIETVSTWLAQQGMTVEHVMKGGRIVEFSSTVGNFEQAFQTEFHRYQVGAAQHISINSELSIPTALRSVIRAIPTVHDFFRKATIVQQGTGQFRRTGNRLEPLYTNGSTHYLSPLDIATIYNTTPLLDNGINGAGIKIGIVGRSDIGLNDIQSYRELFGLPLNNPNFIVVGADPGTVAPDDEESDLDVEISGGVAQGATIDFVTSKATLTVDGVDLSFMYLVENNLTDIISESYEECEYDLGTANLALENTMREQASAQGISVFVSTGDNGPASCDSSGSSYETYGYAVGGLASSPYDVAVGGSEFYEGSGSYWATGNSAGYSSALGYIPEVPWNEARSNGYGYSGDGSGLWAGSGGISAYYTTPSWQRGPGITGSDPSYEGYSMTTDPASPAVAGPHRYLPDVVMNAAGGHDGTFICSEGNCEITAGGALENAGVAGGTSVAAPTMAGVQALIDQANGGRQGLPNYQYYSLVIANNLNGLICTSNAENLSAGCAFHDITTGNNYVCARSSCSTNSLSDEIGWSAASGYDLASGLGSPNVYQIATQWASVTFTSSVTELSIPTIGSTHGSASTLKVTVASGSGSGTPTGNVAFYTSSGAITNPINADVGDFTTQAAFCTLSGGSCTIQLASLPAGSYNVLARYAGDGSFGSSISAPVAVSVTSESSVVSLAANAYNCTSGAITPSTSFPYGSLIYIDASVAGASGQGVPTGTLSITDGGNPLTTQTLNANGAVEMVTGVVATSNCNYGYSYNNLPPLTGGTHILSAGYSGDSNFAASTLATPVTISITSVALAASLKANANEIASGASLNLILTLTPLLAASLPAAPTGSVTFVDTTTSTTLGTISVSNGLYAGTAYSLASLNTAALSTAGTHNITATYAGDGNYASSLSSVSVAVGGSAINSITLNATTTNAAIATSNMLTATLTYSGSVPTGTIYFYDGSTVLGSSAVSASTHAATLAADPLLATGMHNITATYGGNSTYSAKTSSPLTITVTQATPTLTLTVQNTAPLGSPVTMTTVLQSSSPSTALSDFPPTGSVQYYDGATPIGSPAAFTHITGGYLLYEATSSISTLAVGTHTITAVITDTNYVTTTSYAQTVVITSTGSTTVLTASVSNVVPGQAVILTATVTGGSATPTGTVTFHATPAGAVQTTLATATLVSGSATYYGLVPVGTDSIMATYNGDSNYSGSISNTVTVVNASVNGKLNFNWPFINWGQSVSYGASTAPWPVILQNLTGVTVAAPTLSLSGTGATNFLITSNTCVSALPQGASCIFSVVFTPITGGSVNGTTTSATLTAATSTSSNYSASISVSGIAVFSLLGFNWPFLNFTPTVAVGSSSSPWPVTLTNLSGTSTTLASPVVSFTDASFAISNDSCSGETLSPFGSCLFAVVFTPLATDITQSGTNIISGTMSASGNSGAVTATLPVSGWASAPLGFNWPFIAFQAVAVGATGSNPWPVTVTNYSGQSLSGLNYIFTGVNNYQSGAFSLTGTCPALAAGASCTFNILPTPQAGQSAGAYSATLTVGNGSLNSYPLSVSGAAIASGFAINWNQDQQAGVSTIDFGPQNTKNVTAGPWPITVYNNTLTAETLTLTPSLSQFTIAAGNNSCASSVPAGGSCVFGLDFTPTADTSYQGTLTITGSASGSYIFNTWGGANK